ncbi:nucleotide-sugar transporter, putative [Bodo saltans]|uniref:Nucleotide-sugar transporter, putative n=1 Tax=Bodo saltans TaxID=75058 RepID=A0A0S4JAS7_BODSA|nr:nucleotide-sugar transporter, putative [Bodo saltans]|eukprot:CUG88674.1 nucleotide-sugar transporter, putative [Bodo saltans]
MTAVVEAPLPKCYCGVPLRYFSLCALTLQTTAAVIITRYSKVIINPGEPQYASTSLVVTTEALKFVLSMIFIYIFDVPAALQASAQASKLEEGETASMVARVINANDSRTTVWTKLIVSQNFSNKVETLKLAVPALLYTLQNNMIYVALANLEATTFQVGYQSKVITTAVLSVLMLNRSLSWNKWVALFILTGGIVATQIRVATTFQVGYQSKVITTAVLSVLMLNRSLSLNKWVALFILTGGIVATQIRVGGAAPSDAASAGNPTVGIAAVLFSAFCSAFAGVYFEKILKGTNPSVWMRNAQLAFFSMIVGLITYFASEPAEVRFFQGYNGIVLSLILIQAAGGLIIAVVVKYADNILKGFATAMSIVLCGALSSVMMGFEPSALFVMGSTMAIGATMLYSAA